jgi:hypothetical protein
LTVDEEEVGRSPRPAWVVWTARLLAASLVVSFSSVWVVAIVNGVGGPWVLGAIIVLGLAGWELWARRRARLPVRNEE